MVNYLLLRNNKQQGPLSLQHLIQLGLKPYDLVWVEGKSAAWRYPSEIPELKPYCIVVEEQPYDRFFKKPGEKKEEAEINYPEDKNSAQPAIVRTMNERKETPEIVFPAAQQMHAVNPDYKYMPKLSNSMSDIVFPEDTIKQEDIIPKETFRKKSVYVTLPLQSVPVKRDEPVFNVQSSPAPDTREEPLRIKTNYEQPLDEIKEMYVQKLQERKKQTFQKKFVTESLKKAAVIIAIISVGVLIGFAIKSENANIELAASPSVQQNDETASETIQANNTEVLQQETLPAESVIEPVIRPVIERQEPVQQPVAAKSNSNTENTQQPATVENRKAVMTKQKTGTEKDEPLITETAPGVDVNASTGERTKKIRQGGSSSNPAESYEKTEANEEAESKVSIASYVNVKSNDYHVVALGGIRNLQLTVLNDSKYVLDNVTVEVEYLKANKETFKTESVQFKSVAPNGTLTIRMPDTNRGMKVVYKVVRVESKEFRNDMAGL
jgi:hypothetical protein